MKDCVRQVCILSIFCGVAISLCPPGGVKRILHLLCSVILFAVILNPIRELDFSSLPLELAKYREEAKRLEQNGEELRDRLNRLVIEEEVSTYIEERANALGLQLKEIQVQARWSTEDGIWYPDSTCIHVNGQENIEILSGILWSELGIPKDKQEWIEDD